ncbi:MAG: hypothetical protein ITG01_11735 [Comamonas sp.]|nr:hypothetical protein [Comamonas sp.]
MSNKQKTSSNLLGLALIEALDLPKNVTKLSICMEAGKPTTIEATYFPEAEQVQKAGEAVQMLAGRLELREI